jgi:hypothetical protein
VIHARRAPRAAVRGCDWHWIGTAGDPTGYDPLIRLEPILGAISSAGRAPPRQGGGHWFEPSIAHCRKVVICRVVWFSGALVVLPWYYELLQTYRLRSALGPLHRVFGRLRGRSRIGGSGVSGGCE